MTKILSAYPVTAMVKDLTLDELRAFIAAYSPEHEPKVPAWMKIDFDEH